LSKLHKEYYALPPFNPEYIKNRATTLSKLSKDNIDSFEWLSEIKLQNGITCNNPKFVNAYSGDIFPIDINAYIHSDKENSFIEINNTLFSPDSCKNPQFPVSKPLHVTGITLKNGITVRDDTSYPIILEPEGSPAIVHINIPESSRGKIVEGYITTKGRDNPFNFKAEEAYVEPLKSTTLTDINISYLLEKYPFFQKEADQLSIDRGVYKINEPLILPRGINLNISAGTTITFSSDAFIHLRGELNINGTEQEPVILKGNKGEVWKGIAVIGSKNRSKILYTNVQDITFTELGQWKLTGGITFYESDVDIINSKISRSTSEDAINIIRSDFTVKNTDITDALSDAIDSDFSKGFITDSTFSSIKGDGIDTSGSKITIERVKISNVGDKAISVGEESIVFINDIIVDSTKIAIASKDASEVELNKASISNISKAAFMSYIKKKEYGTSASLLADNIVFGVNVKHKAIAEKNTFISVNGNIVERDGDEKNARTKK
ncbi:right-handed parallel beta-helix repeat-containing protein, partial [Pelagibacteraceae bacterium]|nr:right-handed parallel beta-helix repeat-containing protein [Pelagibacteraceae bacterium]